MAVSLNWRVVCCGSPDIRRPGVSISGRLIRKSSRIGVRVSGVSGTRASHHPSDFDFRVLGRLDTAILKYIVYDMG